jgi:hypothetical protein
MGRTAARHAAAIGAVTEVITADLRGASAARAAESIATGGGPTITATAVDVLDPVAIRRLLDRCDAVLNCAGPFFRIGVPALTAAIDTGTTYLDICDDPDPTEAMLDLHERAVTAGVVAVVGMGASPGLSNLLAMRAAAELDSVTDCITAWPLDAESPDGTTESDRSTNDSTNDTSDDTAVSGALVHFMEQIHGEVVVVDNGVHVRRTPLEAVAIDYPAMGRGTGYVVGHPEPITLRDSLGVSGRCVNVVVTGSGTTAAYLRGLQRDLDRGELTLERAGALLLRPTATRGARAAIEGLRLGDIGRLPPFFALVTGTRGGNRRTVGCHVTTLPRGMAGATSIPAALGLAQLLDQVANGTATPGVHPPERVIDAHRLLDDLIAHCPAPVASVDDLAPLVSI